MNEHNDQIFQMVAALRGAKHWLNDGNALAAAVAVGEGIACAEILMARGVIVEPSVDSDLERYRRDGGKIENYLRDRPNGPVFS